MGRKPKRIPVVGDEFGEWTVIGVPVDDDRVSMTLWKCRCSCGEIKDVKGHNLLGGNSKSCGHSSRKGLSERLERLRVRRSAKVSWQKLLLSVDRGKAEMDSLWRSFECFFEVLGERPYGTLLSRHDLDGAYTADNCFWEGRREQLKRLRARKVANIEDLCVKDGSTKRCPKCKQEKRLVADFYVSVRAKNGYQSRCKICLDEDGIIYRRANPAREMIKRAKQRALDKGFEFALTPEQLEPLPTHCPVFGFLLTLGNGQQNISAYSLDRIDNSKGYVPGNVVVMSYLANRLKNDGTAAQHARLARWMSAMEKPAQWLQETAGASEGLL
jgi:hypothetical protein